MGKLTPKQAFWRRLGLEYRGGGGTAALSKRSLTLLVPKVGKQTEHGPALCERRKEEATPDNYAPLLASSKRVQLSVFARFVYDRCSLRSCRHDSV